MLEYITYKKVKKHRAEKAASLSGDSPTSPSASSPRSTLSRQSTHRSYLGRRPDSPQMQMEEMRPVLSNEDERFLAQLMERDEPGPALPPRPNLDWLEEQRPDNSTSLVHIPRAETTDEDHETDKDKKKSQKELKKDKKEREKLEKEAKKDGKFSLFKKKAKNDAGVMGAAVPNPEDLPEDELEREKEDVQNILGRLNLATKNNKVLSMADDHLQKFTQVFKDLANGVPTAYDDLTNLIDDRDGTIQKGFDKLPASMQRLVAQLPDKVTNSLGPEVLMAAAASQGIQTNKSAGVKGMAQSMLLPKNLMELVTKPGAIVSMLKAIVGVLKTRWPAFIGVNVIWSVAICLLMFVLWYCYKRGREVRLDQEALDNAIDGRGRVEELDDDPMLTAPSPRERSHRDEYYSDEDYPSERRERARNYRHRPEDHRRERQERYDDEYDYRSERYYGDDMASDRRYDARAERYDENSESSRERHRRREPRSDPTAERLRDERLDGYHDEARHDYEDSVPDEPVPAKKKKGWFR